MLLGLVPGVVVGGGVVEFVEADCVAPAGDGAGGLADTTTRMEGTALNARGRPDLRARPRAPTAPVGDDQGRWRDPAHERAPGPRILTPSRVPAQHAIGCLGDEHHGVSAQVDTVDEDDVMNLIDDRAERP